MSDELVAPTGVVLFDGERGERRLTWAELTAAPPEVVADFQRALRRYIDEHPRFDVVVLDDKKRDELVVRWRYRR